MPRPRNLFRWRKYGVEHDAFSHSAQCDEFFSKICDLSGGQPHPGCACWCHAIEFDNDAPPEYVEL